VCDVFPSLGRRLQDRALAEWPPAFAAEPDPSGGGPAPEVSFVVGHRGLDRVPHLRRVLASIAGQTGARVECVVVEQSAQPELAGRVPEWVSVVHTPAPTGMPYSRAWAFNVGARAAGGALLAFHDNDMIVPARYAAELLAVRRLGYEVMNLKRFVFYLGERETARVLDGEPIAGPPERVIQNLEGGGSVAIDRDAFFAIGGFDESFVGWGGEDNEFWERAAVRAVWPWGYLPLVHLYHAEQPEKRMSDRRTAALLEERSRIAPEERVGELRARAFGRPQGPDPAYAPPGTP
jgi:GT2 family glycosyltransferase